MLGMVVILAPYGDAAQRPEKQTERQEDQRITDEKCERWKVFVAKEDARRRAYECKNGYQAKTQP
jgi:hypothetical protein